MSLELVHWYVVDTDGMTIVACGTIQAAHVDTLKVAAGQTLRVGVVAHPLEHWEQNGRLIPYAPVQKDKRLAGKGRRGWVWKASLMDYQDVRTIDQAREDKTVALMAEHAKRKSAPVTFNGMTFEVSQETLHRANFAAQLIPGTMGTNDLRWRDSKGVVQTFATAAAYISFMKGWGGAVSQQFTAVDRWKDDLLDQINAAKFNAAIDAITW